MPKAKNLKYCRKKAGLTQQKLADALGISVVTVNNWESRRHAIPAPSSKKLADFFGIDYETFCSKDLELKDTGDKIKRHAITDNEVKMLMMFRKLPDDLKQLIRHVIVSHHRKGR